MSSFGDSSLHIVVFNEELETIKELLKAGANVNVMNYYNVTPLHYASINGSIEIIDILLASGADVNIPNKNGMTPADLAMTKEIKRYMLNYKIPS